MAPVERSSVADLALSSLELDRRASDAVLEPVRLLASRAAPPTSTPTNKGAGTIDPFSVNNKGVLALFGLLFAGLVITAIWFFFWAKNGGFIFRPGDWEDYKSTVLRRKDRHGKTLSNATKSTDLGQASLAGEYDQDEPFVRSGATRRDPAVREYRHEKAARVGGLNRKADGSYTDHTMTEMSETSSTPIIAAKKSKAPSKAKSFFHREKKATLKKKGAVVQTPRQPSTTYSFTNGDDDGSTQADSPGRQTDAAPHRHGHGHGHAHGSPHRAAPPRFKGYRDREDAHSEAPTATSHGYTDDSGDIGTKAYSHHIPGLSRGVPATEASFERGERRGKAGYRRGDGRGGRRDSLSDSD
ncbi:MAG: hypothetical protein M1832_002664 [Thelocarpon impressellum]|nr:MAG: hypothetical protein M1832_002664 [Thelocarpon impressellum]